MFLVSAIVFAIMLAMAYSSPPPLNSWNSYPVPAALFQPALASHGRESFICSAVLITPSHALTIAECVSGMTASDLSIRTGANSASYTNTSIKMITTHPGFIYDTLANDIAILTLMNNVSYSVARLPPPETNSTISSSVDTVTLRSWGSTQNTTQKIPPRVNSHNVNILPSSECAKKLSSCFSLDPAQHFCTEASDEGQTYGDAGGAVIDVDGALVGLISGNPECAGGESVALEVNLSAFEEWIQGTIEDK